MKNFICFGVAGLVLFNLILASAYFWQWVGLK
jgi:hypothetical protein